MSFFTPRTSSGTSKVKVSSGDTTEDYLFAKLVAGSNVTITKNNTGSNETVTIASTGSGSGGGAILSQTVSGTINGVNAVFTVSSLFSGKSFIDLNGNIFAEGTDYTVSGTTITYNVAPPLISNGSNTHVLFASASSTASPTVTSGSGAPVSTPDALGSEYIDIASGNVYIAIGITSSADWKLMASY